MAQEYQVLTKAPFYTENQDAGHLTINAAFNMLSHSPTIVAEDRGRTVSTSLLAGAKVNGKAWLLGAATTAGDDWNGHSYEFAIWYSGWVFRPAAVNEWFHIKDVDQLAMVTSLGPPLKLRLLKKIAFGALPNNTTKSVAHNIASFPVAKGSRVRVFGTISDGTTVKPIPFNDGTDNVRVSVTATNYVIQTGTNLSGWDGVGYIEWDEA